VPVRVLHACRVQNINQGEEAHERAFLNDAQLTCYAMS
jgi:hypothetical protein